MMSRFLAADDEGINGDPSTSVGMTGETVGMTELQELLAEAYQVLQDLCGRIETFIGEG